MLTPDQQEKLRRANDAHLAGDTTNQALSAFQELKALGDIAFEPDDKRIKSHAEYSTQALVFSTSQVLKEQSFETAFPLLQRISEILEQHYPLAANKEELGKRKMYWQRGFEGRNGYAIALRDMYRAFRLLSGILHDQELALVTNAIEEKLKKYCAEYPKDRESIQFFIQEGTYAEASQALMQYINIFEKGNLDESIQLRATVFGKTLKEHSVSSLVIADVIFASLMAMIIAHPKKAKFILEQIVKKSGDAVLNLKQKKMMQLYEEYALNPSGYDVSQIKNLGTLHV